MDLNANDALGASHQRIVAGVAPSGFVFPGAFVNKRARFPAPDSDYCSFAVQTVGVEDSASLLGGLVLPGEFTYRPTVLSKMV